MSRTVKDRLPTTEAADRRTTRRHVARPGYTMSDRRRRRALDRGTDQRKVIAASMRGEW